MAGYSGTPLARKLGIKEGSRLYVSGAPRAYSTLVSPLPEGVTTAPLSVRTDVIHIFSTKKADLARMLVSVMKKMRPDAAIWVSWPKKSSGAPTDITEDTVRAVALPMGLVDIKVCAVDDTWSGLKLVIRRDRR
jgi:hypothetical protein